LTNFKFTFKQLEGESFPPQDGHCLAIDLVT